MAAARSRSFVAIQRALKKQSLGGKEGRFAVNRTLLNLKRCEVNLGDQVKSIDVNFASSAKQNYGLKKFLYEEIPRLKFKNPHVQVVRNKAESTDPKLVVKFVDGKEESIESSEKTSSQILNELINVTSSKKVNLTDDRSQESQE